jgi:hypothetical protein
MVKNFGRIIYLSLPNLASLRLGGRMSFSETVVVRDAVSIRGAAFVLRISNLIPLGVSNLLQGVAK